MYAVSLATLQIWVIVGVAALSTTLAVRFFPLRIRCQYLSGGIAFFNEAAASPAAKKPGQLKKVGRAVFEINAVFLFHNLFQQRLIAVHYVIDHISVADRLKMLSCTVDFRFLNEPELHGGHGAFRLSNKVDMLDGTFIESNRPVRIIVSYRRCDIEAVRQLHINRNICVGVQIGSKIALVRGIVHDMIV